MGPLRVWDNAFVPRRARMRPAASAIMVLPYPRRQPASRSPPAIAHAAAPPAPTTPAVRLARSIIFLDDGHPVGLTVAGRGVPLVVANGFSAQGAMYAQTLSRLVGMGFKVIAIDTPGHGDTGLPATDPGELRSHVELMSRIIDHLGVDQAVFLGHSLGGRLITEVAASDPSRVVAVILIDAIVGQQWDEQLARMHSCPVMGIFMIGRLAFDTASVFPVLADPQQARKFLSLARKGMAGTRPRSLLPAGMAIYHAPPSTVPLDVLGDAGVPAVVIHGAGDLAVPLESARDAAARLGAELAVIDGARHSWMFRDPETLPAILGKLLAGSLGDAWAAALSRAGLDPASATLPEIEDALYRRAALAVELTPPLEFTRSAGRRRPPAFTFAFERP